MKLIGFTLSGYRRFLSPSSVKLNADMIAFVGPNEAGKSSLLRALAHLDQDDGFARDEQTRRRDVEVSLTWHFELSAEDRLKISDITEAAAVRSVRITKKSEGGRVWRFLPGILVRDRTARTSALERLKEIQAPIDGMSEHQRLSRDNVQGAVDVLERSDEVLDADALAYLTDVAEALDTVRSSLEPDDGDPESEPAVANAAQIEGAARALREVGRARPPEAPRRGARR